MSKFLLWSPVQCVLVFRFGGHAPRRLPATLGPVARVIHLRPCVFFAVARCRFSCVSLWRSPVQAVLRYVWSCRLRNPSLSMFCRGHPLNDLVFRCGGRPPKRLSAMLGPIARGVHLSRSFVAATRSMAFRRFVLAVSRLSGCPLSLVRSLEVSVFVHVFFFFAAAFRSIFS